MANFTFLIGRLTKSPEVRYTASQMAVCKFTLAIDRYQGDEKKTDFIPVTVFGKSAENCEKYLSKGRLVGVQGRIQTGSYEKDGRTVYTTDVAADRVEFLERGEKKESQNTSQPKYEAPDGFTEIDGDIPF